MKLFLLLLFLIISTNLFAEVVSTITDRKTGDRIEINCLDQSCSQVEFGLNSDDQAGPAILGTYARDEYLKLLNRLEDKDKLSLKEHFFPIIQGISKLPWDNEEFVVVYFVLSPFTFPLTAAAVALDVAFTPVMAADYTVDAVNGNLGKKIEKSVSKKRDFKITHYRFRKLSRLLVK